MSDTAGASSARPEGGRALGPGTGSSASGRARRRRRAVYRKPEGNITPDEAAAAELERFGEERPTALVEDARNILPIGSDSRSGEGNARYGRDAGAERSDTVILLRLSAGRRGATAVSVPRDLTVDVPGCRRPDGSRSEPVFAMFDSAFVVGRSSCAIRTVEKPTDIRVDHHVVVDFAGFKDVIDAVGGVGVCPREPDEDAGPGLPAGRGTPNGEQALGHVRARKALGDGSDTGRMERRQRFLGALAHTRGGNDVLLNPVRPYPVLDAAASSLTTDPGLAGPRSPYGLVRGLRDIPTEGVQFLTVPGSRTSGT